MRKTAVAFCLVCALGAALPGTVLSETSAGRRDHGESFALAESPQETGFTLAASARRTDALAKPVHPGLLGPDQDAAQAVFFEALVGPAYPAPEPNLIAHAGPAVSLIASGLAGPAGKRESPPRLSLAIFLGRGNGDPFSSLHETYAWRAAFKTMNLGAGLYRDIPITKVLRIRPYLGIIRSHAIVRPSSPYAAESASFESRLTAVCIGLPLVCGF
jgi:hypothetical protein